MKALITAVLLLCSFTSHGQRIRFLDTTNRWHCTESNMGVHTYTARIMRDSFFNGHTYYYLNSNTEAWVRQDTIGNKVYCYLGSNEVLLYDYNLLVGQQFTTPEGIIFTITSMSSITHNGQQYKIWHHDKPPGIGINGSYIEEMGGGFDPLQYVHYSSIDNNDGDDWSLTLNWFQNQGKNVYPCTSELGINETELNGLNGTNVVPNPAARRSKIIFPYRVREGSVRYYNVTGRKVAEERLDDQKEIALPASLLNGIYFYTVTDEEKGISVSGRFVYGE